MGLSPKWGSRSVEPCPMQVPHRREFTSETTPPPHTSSVFASRRSSRDRLGPEFPVPPGTHAFVRRLARLFRVHFDSVRLQMCEGGGRPIGSDQTALSGICARRLPGQRAARKVLGTGRAEPGRARSLYLSRRGRWRDQGGLGEGEGSESWWGWSWKLPVGWRGTDSWGMLFEFIPYGPRWPSYGMLNFDAATKKSLRLGLHTGLTPNPGSGLYDSAYQKWVTLLGPGSPRPMIYGKWLDFYMHVLWRSRTNGILQIWYRVSGHKKFTKLYSDVPGDGALIQVPPHPTLLYNTANGVPGEDGK